MFSCNHTSLSGFLQPPSNDKIEIMKKVLESIVGILLILGLALGLFYYLFFSNNCQIPISYSLGQRDSRFKISAEKVLAIAQDAAGRWNAQTGENLFKYDPNSKLKINLVYDSRQADLDKINAEITSLTNQQQTVENSLQQYQTLLAAYRDELSSYNQKVEYWNSHGGAPPEIYAQLQQEKISLEQQRNDLIQMAQILNLQAQNYNENLDSLKNELDQRKNLIITQGEYDPNRETINIYTFGNADELRLVLMHELGHALGLPHDEQPTSIMYHLLDQQNLKNPVLSEEDINLLQKTCHLNYYSFPILDRLMNNLRIRLKPIQ